ncbi:hypothetical protein J6590_086190 [Homalodisca vitripennis]|nr:hypothetical protein J6590_086190 [Homalodisca vitripennis]
MKISVFGAMKMFKWNLVMMQLCTLSTIRKTEEPDTDDIIPKVFYSDGLMPIDAVIAYIEQQKESTPLDLLTLQGIAQKSDFFTS